MRSLKQTNQATLNEENENTNLSPVSSRDLLSMQFLKLAKVALILKLFTYFSHYTNIGNKNTIVHTKMAKKTILNISMIWCKR